MKMMATMSKVEPPRSASLSDTPLTQRVQGATGGPPAGGPPASGPPASGPPASAPPASGPLSLPTVQPGSGINNTNSSQAASSFLASRVDNLISNNSPSDMPAPSMTGYTGPTIPDLRKDVDLADLVRSEVQRMITTQLPSLQKVVASSQPGEALQNNHLRVQQQLADFQAQQKLEMEQFAKRQEEQFLDLQQQLHGTVGRPAARPPLSVSARPAAAATYPSTISDHPA